MLHSPCFDFNNLLILNNSSNTIHTCILTISIALFLLAWHGFFCSMKILYILYFSFKTALSNIVKTYKGKRKYMIHLFVIRLKF